MSEVCAGCCPSCDWLRRCSTPHTRIGQVLSFPHTSPSATPQPSNALLHGSELARGQNSTKSCRFAARWHASVAVAYICGSPNRWTQIANTAARGNIFGAKKKIKKCCIPSTAWYKMSPRGKGLSCKPLTQNGDQGVHWHREAMAPPQVNLM